MLSIALNEKNGNGCVDPEPDAKRDRRNKIRRIRRVLRKDGSMDLHYFKGNYYPVPVRYCLAIDVEQFGRRVRAIQPIGICDVCREIAWHHVEGVDLCDNCAAEVRR